MAINHLVGNNWFDGRENLKNKPSLSRRTLHVVDHLMVEEELPLGIALEKLMKTPNLYENIIEKLKDDYPDIEEKY